MQGNASGLNEPVVRLERVKGIEPSYSAWEADVLPLNYTRNAAKDAQAAPCLQVKSFRA
tara:strand:- start:167 stop:343 length:177 start_codon:yes stop_codon:yes gene_type:complete